MTTDAEALELLADLLSDLGLDARAPTELTLVVRDAGGAEWELRLVSWTL